jgi:hypothetical protein
MESWAIIDTQDSIDAANYAANDSADNCTNRTCIVFANASTVRCAVWYALSLRAGRHRDRNGTCN